MFKTINDHLALSKKKKKKKLNLELKWKKPNTYTSK